MTASDFGLIIVILLAARGLYALRSDARSFFLRTFCEKARDEEEGTELARSTMTFPPQYWGGR